MKRRRILAILIVCIISAAFMLAACGDEGAQQPGDAEEATEKGIVGDWVTQKVFIYHFRDDGTGYYEVGEGNDMDFEYTYDDSELSIQYEGSTSPMVLKYELNGDTLTIYDSFDNPVDYTRL